MAESATSLKGLRAQMAAAAQAQAEERRSLSGNSPGPTPPSTTAKPQGPKPVIDGAVIRIDEKLRVAKERREEADRQQALRDNQIVERERKAKLQVERQMEERQKKLDEQRRKEEQKRSAVEEKRKLKAEEEKEHYEAVMRRTLERSQRVEQRQKRWSWGGLSTDSDGRAGDSDASVSSPVAIEITPASPQKPPRKKQVDKRSTSTMNLKQSGDAAISKRLSTSSATLIKTPDKSAKRRSASCQRLPSNGIAPQAKEDGKKPQVEKPGRSVMKRSSSLSRGGGVRAQTPPAKPDKGTTDDQASASPLPPPPRGPLRSRSIDRQKSGMTGSVSADGALDPSLKDRRLTSPMSQRPPSPSNSLGRNRSPSPAPPPAPKRTPSPAPKRAPSPAPKRTPSPAAAKQGSRSRPPSPGAGKQRPPSPQPNAAAPASKPPPIQKPALTPTGPQTLRKRDSKSKDLLPGQPVHPPSPDSGQASASPSPSPAPPAPHSKSKDKDDPKAMVGTSSKEEAAKMLAENRRLAREQKEKDELLRVQREEEERLRKEEEQRLAEVARLEREEQQKRQAEEKAQRDEEEALLAEEDRVRLAAEEVLRQEELQREREEAEARALEEAERVRVERERVLQQNQQERMERKKRIEEIMKRTRKGEDSDKRDGDDDDKDDQDDGEDDVDDIDCEAKEDDMVHHGDADGEADAAKEEECCVAGGEPASERQTPVGSVNGQSDTDDKENNNDMSTDGTQAVSPIPKSRLVEGSEFLNEEDASKAGLVPGVNGKPGPWSFEELIDLNVHSKSRPLLQSEDRNQGLIDCDGASDGPPRGGFEDNGAPGVKSMHSSPQPLEALAEV
ncbi:ensconsin isoform X4 [Gadus morhua]|uniref:MAP7 domain containing 3 n=1 Tax=Gadus morhua TaxID=8049 RepID=A0A8C5ABP0_GADMO|nr:ensconsin-like isoform X4 [Gadus morhua]